MKTTHFAAILLAAFAGQLAFAGTATILEVKGLSGPVTNDTVVQSAKDQKVDEGSIIETAADGAMKLALSNGSTLTLGAKTRILLKFTGDVVEISLLRGTISGDFKAGTTVRTAAGIASIGGIKAGIQFAQGNLVMAPVSGTASFKPAGNNPSVTVPAGNTLSVAANGTATPSALTPDQVTAINSGSPTLALIPAPEPIKSKTPVANTQTTPPGATPNLTQLVATIDPAPPELSPGV